VSWNTRIKAAGTNLPLLRLQKKSALSGDTIMDRSTATLALIGMGALCALVTTPARAQVVVAPPPSYAPPLRPAAPPSALLPNGFAQGYGNGNSNLSQNEAPGAGAPSTLPPGIGHLWGMEGTNEILLYGTQAGYDLARQLIRGLDGDTDIDRTTIEVARETPAYVKSLGVTLGPTGTITPADAQKLMDAWQDGQITAIHELKVTSGDGEAVETNLGRNAAYLPFALTATAQSGLQVEVALTAPVTATLSLAPGVTGVLAVPAASAGHDPIVSLLFVTAGIVKSG
jgi:hypothetical protein